MASEQPAINDSQRRANLRLAWILLSAVVVLAIGFVAKVWLFSH
jgi:hypothetical protein